MMNLFIAWSVDLKMLLYFLSPDIMDLEDSVKIVGITGQNLELEEIYFQITLSSIDSFPMIEPSSVTIFAD